MDLKDFMRRYAKEIGGEYNDYSPELVIVIIPVSGGRAQTVITEIKNHELYNRSVLSITSKVCPATNQMDYRSILSQTSFLNYSRFVISENYLQVQAVAPADGIAEASMKEMIQEVANVADQFEMKITGADVQ